MRNKILAISLASLVLPGVAAAAEQDAKDLLYLRGGVGVAEVDSQSDTGSETTSSIGLGWRFKKKFSVDLNYETLGEWEQSVLAIGGPLDATTRSLSVGLGGTVDFGKSGFFAQARAGVHQWETKYENFETSYKEDGTDPFYTVGLGYDFNEYFGVILSYERFMVGSSEVGDVDRLMLGFEFR